MSRLLRQQAVGQHVRRLREQTGMSVRTLARQTGFSPSFMSQLENGQVSPSINSMELIAGALGVTLGEFFAAVTGAQGGLIVRVSDRRGVSSGWSNAEIEALSVPGPTFRLEVLLITLGPGGRSGKHPYSHHREEFAFVLQGEAVLTLGPDEHRLRRGDAAKILPDELRLWQNRSRAPVRILVVSSPAGVSTKRSPGARNTAGSRRDASLRAARSSADRLRRARSG